MSYRYFVPVALVLLILSIPVAVSAATKSPTCSLEIETKTTQKEMTVRNNQKESMVIDEGEEVKIAWKSKDARMAVDGDGDKIKLSGSATYSPKKTTTYSYRFTSGSKKTTCTVVVTVASGKIATTLLTKPSSKPTLSGTALGTKTVRLTLYKKGSTKTLYKSKDIKVRGGKWKVEISKKLSDGAYDVELIGSKEIGSALLAKETLIVGAETQSNVRADTTLAVSLIPLLAGGTARAGASVPISYLQVTNLGKESASVTGFSVKQNGSASTNAVIGLTASDDVGTTHGSVGGIEGTTPFKNGIALVPVDTAIPPGTMRLFTIKAILTANVSAHLGKQLMIDVASVTTNASTQGIFPIRGTTWTIGY